MEITSVVPSLKRAHPESCFEFSEITKLTWNSNPKWLLCFVLFCFFLKLSSSSASVLCFFGNQLVCLSYQRLCIASSYRICLSLKLGCEFLVSMNPRQATLTVSSTPKRSTICLFLLMDLSISMFMGKSLWLVD